MNFLEALELAAFIETPEIGYRRIISVDFEGCNEYPPSIFVETEDGDESNIDISELKDATLYHVVELEYE